MAGKKSGYFPIIKGDHAVIDAAFFQMVGVEAAKGKAALAIMTIDGGSVVAFIPDETFGHLRRSVREIARLRGLSSYREKLSDWSNHTKRALKRALGYSKHSLRLKPGEMRSVRADASAIMAMKDTTDGRSGVTVNEEGGGTITILLPDKSLTDFATAALQAIRLARTEPGGTQGSPAVEIISRVIVPDRIKVLAEPEQALAKPDQEILVLEMGGVELQFAATKDTWKLVLEAMINRPNG